MDTTTAPPLPTPSPAVAATLPARSYERERTEGTAVLRGLLYATVFVVLVYGPIIAGVVAVVHLVNAGR